MVGEEREAGLVEKLLHPAARTTRQQRPLCGAAYGSLCALSSGNMSSRGEHVRSMMAGGSDVERASLCLLSIGERLAVRVRGAHLGGKKRAGPIPSDQTKSSALAVYHRRCRDDKASALRPARSACPLLQGGWRARCTFRRAGFEVR